MQTRAKKQKNGTAWVGRTITIVVLGLLFSNLTVPSRAFAAGAAEGAAADTPTIQLLNPLDLTADTSPDPGSPIVSDKATPANATYRLSAWTANAPVSAVVEFEIDTIPVQTITATRKVGTDTFEADWAIPSSVLDGPHQISAALFTQVGGEEIARDTESVTVLQGNPGQAADNVDLVEPQLGGSLGFYKSPAAWSTILQAVSSSGTTFVQFLYSKSAPGTEPEWTSCVKVKATAAANGVRCDLKGDDTPDMITAIGAIANDSPNPPQGAQYQAQFDRSTDTQRVFPYVQLPGGILLKPAKQKMAAGDIGSVCSKLITATVTDQNGKLIVGANVDVHAVGPGDNTQFGLGLFDDGDASQPPDKGHSREEVGADCNGLSPSSDFIGTQGEHNIAGAPDIKHIETVPAGTNAQGTFSFQLLSDMKGTTQITAWVDQNDDDEQQFDEVTDTAAIGWGQPPGPEPYAVFLEPRAPYANAGACVRFSLGIQQGGDPAGGENVDIHLRGPDPSTDFCDPTDASPRRDPDSGGHVGNKDPNGSIHTEGETAGDGTFVFGVTAAAREDVKIKAWVDIADDDILDAEPFDTAAASFSPTGVRTITLHSGTKRARKGARVNLHGRIKGEAACARFRGVTLKARRAGTRKPFHSIARTTTDQSGKYGFVVKMGAHSRQFRAEAPRKDPCHRARSLPRTVKAS
jgi:hypothetical protein